MDHPRRHHYVPQHYLRRWSPDGKRIVVMRLPVSDGAFVAGIRDIAVESNLYAIETPDGLDQVVERDLTRPIDGAFSSAIDSLLAGDFDSVNPSDLLAAVAFQFVRGPQERDQLECITTEFARVQEKFSRLFKGEDVDEAVIDAISRKPPRNGWVASLLRSLQGMAGVFAQMRWQFVFFKEPLLVTSDSPISQWRRDELDDPNRGMGPMSVDEVRFPLAPTLALVMTWEPGEARIARGDVEMARELNVSTCEFAMRRRFFTSPEPVPPLPQTEAEAARRPVASDLSVLPPMQAHQIEMGESLLAEMANIPGLEDVAAELRGDAPTRGPEGTAE